MNNTDKVYTIEFVDDQQTIYLNSTLKANLKENKNNVTQRYEYYRECFKDLDEVLYLVITTNMVKFLR